MKVKFCVLKLIVKTIPYQCNYRNNDNCAPSQNQERLSQPPSDSYQFSLDINILRSKAMI